jgi:hypothetical protein
VESIDKAKTNGVYISIVQNPIQIKIALFQLLQIEALGINLIIEQE